MSSTILSEVESDVDSAVLMRQQGKLESTWKATAAAKLLAGTLGKSAIRIPAWLGLTIKNPVRVRVMSRIVNRFDSGRILLRYESDEKGDTPCIRTSCRQLAAEIGCDHKTVKLAINWLRAQNYITMKIGNTARRGGWLINGNTCRPFDLALLVFELKSTPNPVDRPLKASPRMLTIVNSVLPPRCQLSRIGAFDGLRGSIGCQAVAIFGATKPRIHTFPSTLGKVPGVVMPDRNDSHQPSTAPQRVARARFGLSGPLGIEVAIGGQIASKKPTEDAVCTQRLTTIQIL